ncbi:MAG TPA: protein-disulfide reductase DsbD N-terminal domain-containing protein [Pyrinomonadaceae bacterium]
MKRTISILVLLFVFLIVATDTGAQTVTGSIGDGTIERGDSSRGKVVLNIPGGLHVNSSRPASEYSIPTVVTVRGPRGVRVSRVTYPRGKNRKFQFSENLINVYEGRVTFPFTVTVPASFRGNIIRVNVAVRYQACTDEVCYPPRTKNVVLTARVQ